MPKTGDCLAAIALEGLSSLVSYVTDFFFLLNMLCDEFMYCWCMPTVWLFKELRLSSLIDFIPSGFSMMDFLKNTICLLFDAEFGVFTYSGASSEASIACSYLDLSIFDRGGFYLEIVGIL